MQIRCACCFESFPSVRDGGESKSLNKQIGQRKSWRGFECSFEGESIRKIAKFQRPTWAFGFRGRVTDSGGHRESIHGGLTAAFLLPTRALPAIRSRCARIDKLQRDTIDAGEVGPTQEARQLCARGADRRAHVRRRGAVPREAENVPSGRNGDRPPARGHFAANDRSAPSSRLGSMRSAGGQRCSGGRL